MRTTLKIFVKAVVVVLVAAIAVFAFRVIRDMTCAAPTGKVYITNAEDDHRYHLYKNCKDLKDDEEIETVDYADDRLGKKVMCPDCGIKQMFYEKYGLVK